MIFRVLCVISTIYLDFIRFCSCINAVSDFRPRQAIEKASFPDEGHHFVKPAFRYAEHLFPCPYPRADRRIEQSYETTMSIGGVLIHYRAKS